MENVGLWNTFIRNKQGGVKMSEKKKLMLDYLVDNSGWHSVAELAIYLDISPRTVKNYYKSLSNNSYLRTSKLGYRYQKYINNDDLQNKTTFPNNENERIFLLLNKLLNNTQRLNIYDLAAEFFVSESTLKNVVHAAINYTQKFHITIKTNGDFFSIKGKESDKRHMLSDMLYKESEGNFINQMTLNENFPTINIDQLFVITKNCATSSNVYLNTFDLSNIILHIAIAIQRVADGYDLQENDVSRLKVQNSQFADNLLKSIENSHIHRVFQIDDLKQLGLIIDGSVSRWSSDILNNLPEESLLLIESILAYIKKIYRIDLKNSGYINQFTIHVSRLIQRLQNEQIIHNPIASSIKVQSPTIYECAVLISHKISDYVGVDVPENEIAYIAMHIGNAIAEQIEDKRQSKVIIVAPDYQGDLLAIANRIEHNFSGEVEIINVVTSEEDIGDVDIIIAINKKIQTKVPIVYISPFLTAKDIIAIRDKIQETTELKERLSFNDQLFNFFDAKFFLIDSTMHSKEEVINYITTKFYQGGVTKADYRANLLQRESMSSTAFGKIAIPHSLRMESNETKGFVYINQKGISWDQDKVYLVIALAVRENDSKIFRNIFDKFSDIMTEEKKVTTIVLSKSYNDFLDNLKLME